MDKYIAKQRREKSPACPHCGKGDTRGLLAVRIFWSAFLAGLLTIFTPSDTYFFTVTTPSIQEFFILMTGFLAYLGLTGTTGENYWDLKL